MPTAFAVDVDGLTIAGLDWGGPADAPVLLLLHPNGFGAGVFHPLARRLAAAGDCRPIGVDLRGHGRTSKPPADPADYGYEALAGDVVGVLDALGIDEVVALGESLGGGVAVVLDRLQPGRIRRLLLCEAIALPMPGGEGGATAGPATGNPMAAIARKRRPVWPNRQAMIDSYGSRPPLDELAPEALEAYVRWGTLDRPDGTVELACPPEVEATLFEAGELGPRLAWAHLPELHAPATVLAGTTSNLPAEWFRAQADAAGAPFHQVDGGHFFVQEDADRAVDLVRRHLLGAAGVAGG